VLSLEEELDVWSSACCDDASWDRLAGTSAVAGRGTPPAVIAEESSLESLGIVRRALLVTLIVGDALLNDDDDVSLSRWFFFRLFFEVATQCRKIVREEGGGLFSNF
jgi:hypothetical protein